MPEQMSQQATNNISQQLLSEVEPELREVLREKYGLRPVKLQLIPSDYDAACSSCLESIACKVAAPEGEYFLKLTSRAMGIPLQTSLLQTAELRKYPLIPSCRKALGGEFFLKLGDRILSLYEWVPSSCQFSWLEPSWTARQTRSAARALASFHSFSATAFGAGAHESLHSSLDAEPSIIVHGDFHAGNLRFGPRAAVVSAITDFDYLHRADPLFDIAYALVMFNLPGPYSEELIENARGRHDVLSGSERAGCGNWFFDFLEPYLNSEEWGQGGAPEVVQSWVSESWSESLSSHVTSAAELIVSWSTENLQSQSASGLALLSRLIPFLAPDNDAALG